jgi:hypothetical protein
MSSHSGECMLACLTALILTTAYGLQSKGMVADKTERRTENPSRRQTKIQYMFSVDRETYRQTERCTDRQRDA